MAEQTEKRKREVAKMHLDELIDMRDDWWRRIVRENLGSRGMRKHAALAHAVKQLEQASA